MTNEPCVRLRRAEVQDRPAVEALLRDAQLPVEGVAEWVDQFWVAEPETGEGLVGVAGLELHGEAALLRSVAVAPAWQERGIARLLAERALDAAREGGAREAFLLTTTAEGYFSRLGFTCIERRAAPAALQASAEFCGACPASATLMRKPVSAGEA